MEATQAATDRYAPPQVRSRAGQVWERKKGELLRPDAFTKRDIRERRDSKQPGFETLQQQNPGGSDRLRIKAKYFPTFSSAELPIRELPVVLSIDPGQKGGPTNSFTVIQAWCPKDGAHLLLDQWRKQARYRKFRSAARRFISEYRPSVVLTEATGQGPALISDLKPQNGMKLVLVTPVGEKVERLRKHCRTIRDGLVQLAPGASWYGEFISEATQFPYGPFDDQMDALSQYLNWIAEHPNPPTRPPMALIQRADYQGRPVGTSASAASTQTKGIVVQRRSHIMPNAPFPQVKTWVKY